MTNSNMTCEAFDAALPDYLEGTLDESRRAPVQEHLSECVRCAGLVRDLEKIQRDAFALPDMVPSRDLWQGIEARIAAPVIPLAAQPGRQRRCPPSPRSLLRSRPHPRQSARGISAPEACN